MTEIKVEDYGKLLSAVKGKPCIAYVEFGSYQGEWVAALDGGTTIELWKGYYGSCSVCDWMEGEMDYSKDTVSLEKAQEHFKEDHSFLDIPKEMIGSMTIETFSELLPANVRGMDEFSPEELFAKVKAAALTN